MSIGVRKPHTPYRVPAGFWGSELYPNAPIDTVKSPKHPEVRLG